MRVVVPREYGFNRRTDRCRCDPKDRCCVTGPSGHYPGCPIYHLYCKAIAQSMAWKRLAAHIITVSKPSNPNPGMSAQRMKRGKLAKLVVQHKFCYETHVHH